MRAGDAGPFAAVTSASIAARVSGFLPTLLAISCSPSCQCMDSANSQGTPSSAASFAHIVSLRLGHVSNAPRTSAHCSAEAAAVTGHELTRSRAGLVDRFAGRSMCLGTPDSSDSVNDN